MQLIFQFKKSINRKNRDFGNQYMLELLQVEDADIEEIMKGNEYSMLAFVLEHHAQSINEVQSGRLKGYWKTYYYENGKRKNKTLNTKEKLVHWLYDFYREGEGLNKTFKTVYNEMVEERLEMGLIGDKTARDYKDSLNKFMAAIANKKISSFNAQMLMKWINKDVLESRPNQTRFEHMICYLGFAFEYAKRMKYIASDPMEEINPTLYYKKCSRGRKKPDETFFTEDEMERLRKDALQFPNNPNALLILFNAEVGTRAGEPVVLRWEDVGRDTISIHSQQIRNDETTPHTFEVVDYTKDTRCKCDGQPREFPITPRILEVLEMARQLPGESEFIFHDKNGNMVKKDTYEQYLRRRCQKLGLTKTNNHCFRRGVNLMLIDLGYDASARARLLGQTTHTNEMDYSPTRVKDLQDMGANMAAYRSRKDDVDDSLTFTQQKRAV